jgi:hypothetical protein
MQRTLEHPRLQDVLGALRACSRIDSDRDGKLTDELGVNEAAEPRRARRRGQNPRVQQGYLSPDMLRPWLEKNLAHAGRRPATRQRRRQRRGGGREARQGERPRRLPELRARGRAPARGDRRR